MNDDLMVRAGDTLLAEEASVRPIVDWPGWYADFPHPTVSLGIKGRNHEGRVHWRWFALNPGDARELARLLIEEAEKQEPQS